MAVRTVKEFATHLGILPEEFLSLVKRTGMMGATSLESKLSDTDQANLASKLQLPQESSVMSEELLETKSKMELLFAYERHYLELIKEFKEEIKFAGSLQEDLRRERSQFFTQTLREVVQTLQMQEIDKVVASRWIEDLVSSYTKSILIRNILQLDTPQSSIYGFPLNHEQITSL